MQKSKRFLQSDHLYSTLTNGQSDLSRDSREAVDRLLRDINFPPVYPPLIYHISTSKDYVNIVDMITKETGLDKSYIEELIDFGAVYLQTPLDLSKAHSGRKIGTAKSKDPKVNYKVGQKSTRLDRTKRQDKSSSPNRNDDTDIAQTDQFNKITVDRIKNQKDLAQKIYQSQYCRVHANPRRYFGGYFASWGERIVRTCHLPGILLVDKPFDLPMSSTVDNVQENLLYCINNYSVDKVKDPQGNPDRSLLSGMIMMYSHIIDSKYFVSSRLDACTSGLTPIPDSLPVASALSAEIADRRVRKFYKVLCKSPKPVPLGILRHCFRRKNQKHSNGKPTLLREYDEDLLAPPSAVSKQIGAEWQLAELEVLSCNKIDKSSLSLQYLDIYEALKTFHGSDAMNGSDGYYECDVELFTGRTHQIRLQFAALNAPIVGDYRYEPVRGLLDEGSDSPWGDGSALFGPEPRIIGLQCHKLEFTRSFALSLQSSTSRELSASDSVGVDVSNERISTNVRGDGIIYTCRKQWWRHR